MDALIYIKTSAVAEVFEPATERNRKQIATGTHHFYIKAEKPHFPLKAILPLRRHIGQEKERKKKKEKIDTERNRNA